jgi:hypothetical protein
MMSKAGVEAGPGHSAFLAEQALAKGLVTDQVVQLAQRLITYQAEQKAGTIIGSACADCFERDGKERL